MFLLLAAIVVIFCEFCFYGIEAGVYLENINN